MKWYILAMTFHAQLIELIRTILDKEFIFGLQLLIMYKTVS